MPAIICPTILARNLAEYNAALERIEGFARRVQLDFTDGDFAPTKTINLIEAHWPVHIHADFHVMHRDPLREIETLIAQHPHLVIVHLESKHAKETIDELNAVRIKTGVAILPETAVEAAGALIDLVEHVLIFGGKLGHYGGEADLKQLDKVKEVRAVREDIEIGWDGGANPDTVRQLADGGIDVINVGGYIQSAPDPQAAYAKLEQIING